MRNDSNLAYKLPKQQEEVRQPKIVKVPKAKPAVKTASPTKVLLFLIVIIGLSFSVMYSRAQLTELTTKVNAATEELDVLQSETVRLKTELESRISLKNVEEYVTMELGLEKLDPSQIEYITLEAELPDQTVETVDDSIWQKIKNFFVDMMEYIGL